MLALAAHLPFLDTPIYGDEAVQYTMARNWGHHQSDATELYTGQRVDYTLVFWQRPAFPVLLAPGAAFGFQAMRIEFVLLTSLLAPLAFATIRAAGGGPPLGAAAGAAVAFDPILALWGTRLFPDALCAVALLAALHEHLRHRHVSSAALFVVAAWTKEIALPALAGLILLEAVRRNPGSRWQETLVHLRPYLAALLLAPIPLLYCTLQGARLPGWSRGDSLGPIAERLFIDWWTLPLLLALTVMRPRLFIGWMALGYPAFFILDHHLRGLAVQEWYLVVPHLMIWIGLGYAVDQLVLPRLQAHAVPSRGAQAIAMAVFLALVMVLTPALRPSALVATVASAEQEQADLMRILDALEHESATHLLLVDVGWYDLEFPFDEHAPVVHYVYTQTTQDSNFSQEPIHALAQRPGALLVQHRWPEMNQLARDIDERYSACRILDASSFTLVRGADCAADAS